MDPVLGERADRRPLHIVSWTAAAPLRRQLPARRASLARNCGLMAAPGMPPHQRSLSAFLTRRRRAAMSLKIRISSPLEAGRSILDAHHLPSGVSAALEYAAGRLARRDLGVTLVAVRREYQVPAVPPAPAAAAPPPCTPRSPGFALPHAAAPLPFRAGLKSAIKGLVRTRTHPVLLLPLPERTRALDPHRSLTRLARLLRVIDGKRQHPGAGVGGLAAYPRLALLVLPHDARHDPHHRILFGRGRPCRCFRRPAGLLGQPADQARQIRAPRPAEDGAEVQPRVSSGAFSFASLGDVPPCGSQQYRPEWLPEPVEPAAYGLTPEVMGRSIAQNEVLFHAEGLTVLSLDHLYTFKCALASYARDRAPLRLEDAVDELRRYVLGNGRRKRLPKSELVHAYEDLHFTEAALDDVAHMYGRAYGGPENPEPAIDAEGLTRSSAPSPLQPPPPRALTSEFVAGPPALLAQSAEPNSPKEAATSQTPQTPQTPETPRSPPALRLQTNFDGLPSPGRKPDKAIAKQRDKKGTWDDIPIHIVNDDDDVPNGL